MKSYSDEIPQKESIDSILNEVTELKELTVHCHNRLTVLTKINVFLAVVAIAGVFTIVATAATIVALLW